MLKKSVRESVITLSKVSDGGREGREHEKEIKVVMPAGGVQIDCSHYFRSQNAQDVIRLLAEKKRICQHAGAVKYPIDVPKGFACAREGCRSLCLIRDISPNVFQFSAASAPCL